MELFPKFSTYSALACRGLLYDVKPVGNAEEWSPEACQGFQDMVKGKIFHGIVMDRTETPLPNAFPENYLVLSVVLAERGEQCKHTLQALMIKAGLAEAGGLM